MLKVLDGAERLSVNRTPQSVLRPLKLWHVLLFLFVVLAVIVVSAATMERRYALAIIALLVVTIGPLVSLRFRKMRASLKPDDDVS